jgi:hypothetical protein
VECGPPSFAKGTGRSEEAMGVWSAVGLVFLFFVLAWQSGAVLYAGSWIIARHVRGREVASRDWHDLAGLGRLEDEWRTIRRELDVLMDNRKFPSFDQIDRLQTWLATYGGRRWRVFVLCAFGQWLEENCAACPETTRLLRETPRLQMAMFSVLEPGKEIPWHRGPYKGVLRYHLGLRIPVGGPCYLEVGDQRYSWNEGVGVVFDDTLRHRAVNDADEPRVVLFLDLVRPAMPAFAGWVHVATVWLMRRSWRVKRAISAARQGKRSSLE